MSEEKLRPCPFCGKADKLNPAGGCGVYCGHCEFSGPEPIDCDPEESIRLWNKRAGEGE